MAKITPKQEQFVKEYLIDLNATQAAIRAGYSVKYADNIASQLMAKTHVFEAVTRAKAERSRRTGISADRVVLELAKIGFANITDVVNIDSASVLESAKRDDTASIQSIKVKRVPTEAGESVEREIRMYDKTKALEHLGRHLGIYDDKLRLEGGVQVIIADDLAD